LKNFGTAALADVECQQFRDVEYRQTIRSRRVEPLLIEPKRDAGSPAYLQELYQFLQRSADPVNRRDQDLLNTAVLDRIT
jgi:hypothetical protein